MITIEEFKERVIADGIAEVKEVYANEPTKMFGALEGFETARQLTTRQEFEEELRARRHKEAEMRDEVPIDTYLHHSWGTLQVEWVLEVMKVAYWATEKELLSSRAAIKAFSVAAEIDS
jgi:hypothetical protein